MNLLIFDIDGTLTDTKEVDDKCFITAFQDEFDVILTNTEWTTFTNVTDGGLFIELYQSIFETSPSYISKMSFQKRFVNYLETELETNKENFKPVKGTPNFIEFCVKSNHYRIAFATGGWGISANIKLKAANIPHENIPLTSSDCHISRQDILLQAIIESEKHYQVENFDNIFYFGDGEWDFKTTKKLKIPFIGVDINKDGRLKKLGTEKIINDFADKNQILKLLNTFD
jgi:phosphoglycolate phosphatase-like HAD superfamily hydrolase